MSKVVLQNEQIEGALSNIQKTYSKLLFPYSQHLFPFRWSLSSIHVP